MKMRHVLEGRPVGHPLHSILTHIPLGLWLMAAVFDVLSYVFNGEHWPGQAAFWTLLLGTIAAVPTAITGFNDFLGVRNDHPAQTTLLWHMALNIAAASLFALATLLHWSFWERAPVPIGISILTWVSYGMVIVSGYLGGVLIYNHGISVGRHKRTNELPQTTCMPDEVDATGEGVIDFTCVGKQSQLQDGETIRAEIDGYIITIAKHNGRYFAFQEFCTHRCGPLSEGTMENDQIQCPWHQSRFDMHTGRVTAGPAKVDLKTFEVRVSDGHIYVRVPKDHEGQEPQSHTLGDLVKPRIPERRNPADHEERDRKETRDPTRQPTDH